MCLAIPLKIIEIETAGGEGVVDMGGARVSVGLALVPEAVVGDYILVHAGMAIQLMDETDAIETLELYRQFAASQDSLAPEKE